jgi:hypothetical protein
MVVLLNEMSYDLFVHRGKTMLRDVPLEMSGECRFLLPDQKICRHLSLAFDLDETSGDAVEVILDVITRMDSPRPLRKPDMVVEYPAGINELCR